MSNNYPFHFQSAVHDCVPACVLSLAEYFNVPVSLKKLRRILVTNPQSGTSIGNLRNLQSLFDVQLGRMVDIEEIPTKTPFVAYLRRGHAVVVWEYNSKKSILVVGDPGVGIVEIPLEEFLQQWDGLTAIIRNRDKIPVPGDIGHSSSPFSKLKALKLNWMPLLPLTLIVTALGIVNSLYSLLFARYLQDFGRFILFLCSYAAATAVLNTVANVAQAKVSLRYAQMVGELIQGVLPDLDVTFYTIGDVSTRYSDAMTVVNVVMGLFRDIPYALIIFTASIYFLARNSVLLVVFVLAFLLLIISMLRPIVRKVQYYMYSIKIKQSQVTNSLQSFLVGQPADVNQSWEESIQTQYKQTLWTIPINSLVSNSAVMPVLFVVIFLHWKTGGAAVYSQLLSAIMIMNYAVSAGHSLYGRYVAWQTAQPSLHRLYDFLSIDKQAEEDSASSSVTPTIAREL